MPEVAELSLSRGARVPGGTDMQKLSRALCDKYGLNVRAENRIRPLQKWEAAIINVGGDRSGYSGFYSTGGHYIVCAGMAGSGYLMLDPGWYRGKYAVSRRKGRAAELASGITVASEKLLLSETAARFPPMYVFTKK